MALPKHALHNERFTLRLSAHERRLLREIAVRMGLTDSDVVRVMIRQAHRQTVAIPKGEAPDRPLR